MSVTIHKNASIGLAAALLAFLSLGVPTATAQTAMAEEALIGADEYMNSCLACHGVGGQGDGPMAEYLTVKPSDLTMITKNNDGVFPLREVFQVIDGRAIIGAHGLRAGDSQMPVWGARYQAEIGGTYGPYGGEQAVRARVLELVYYIQSIQQ